jgi:oligoendopeptidase F
MNTAEIKIPVKNRRRFLPDDLIIDSWDVLKPFFENLKNREFNTVEDISEWLLDRSELEAVLEEDAAWRYIKMNIDTTNQELAESFNFFIQEIQPNAAPYDDVFNKKLVSSSILEQLDKNKYSIYLRQIQNDIKIFREENIPLFTELRTEEQKYGSVCSLMTIEIDGKEITLPQASNYLKQTDRAKREEVYLKLKNRRLQDRDPLNELFNTLVKLRHKVALNAGFSNYRDYKFVELGRFDYTVKDCYDFHESIATEVLALANQIDLNKKEALGYGSLKPWDTEVDVSGKPPLKPFTDGDELLDKTIQCFYRIHPYFGQCLETMKIMGYLDLDSKKGKAPGGFNYPLYEIGVPFIYMNAAGSMRDVVTMVHEGGHAIHSFLNRDLEITAFKNVPSEVAELASMGMELISMDFWDSFFENVDELKRAKREQLEKVISVLPWVAAIDYFQHWIYENPDHSVAEREIQWNHINKKFGSSIIDWSGHEDSRTYLWQKQLHLFEVPFYYIEYGMAQLGAIALWKNFKQNPEKSIEQYMAALKLGYTTSIGEIYRTAGIKFDFSNEYVRDLIIFVKEELKKLD